jgi:hypothetical protein
MATTTVRRRVPLPPDRAAELIADFTTSEHWDPAITHAHRLDDGHDLHVGARFHVDVRAGMVTLPLVYELTTYEPGEHVVLESRGRLHYGRDDVRFEPADDGSTLVEWRATFALRGPGWLLDPALGLGFRRVAAKAGDGLETFLTEAAAEQAGY